MRQLVLVLLLGCGEAADVDVDSPETDTAAPDCADVTNWSTVGAPFVYTWCTPCHSPTLTGEERQGAPERANFASLSDVQAQAGAFEARVFADMAGIMPPGGGPTSDELAAVADWVACGLPE